LALLVFSGIAVPNFFCIFEYIFILIKFVIFLLNILIVLIIYIFMYFLKIYCIHSLFLNSTWHHFLISYFLIESIYTTAFLKYKIIVLFWLWKKSACTWYLFYLFL